MENQDGFEQGALTRIKVEHWKMLNDYTHGGIIQVKSRLNYETIEPNYQPERISRTLTASAYLSFLAGIGIARIAESDEVALKLREAYSTIYKKFNHPLKILEAERREAKIFSPR